MRFVLALAFIAGCGGAPTAPPPPLAASAETPPTGTQEEIEAWLAAGSYKLWRCEPVPHAARPGSGHAMNRICTNTLQSAHAGSGDYPIGAASVKELFDRSGALEGYAVYVRAADGDGGDNRFWYERAGANVYALGFGHGSCVGCHGDAPKDFVYTVVP